MLCVNDHVLTLGSLFSGSGGFELAGLLAGITPIWASEVEPFPIRVTTKRMPQVKHYGDVSRMNGAEIEPVDIITFGSPCQDMSIAGKRAGLEGSRSSLFHEAIRVIKEMRDKTNGEYPKYIVWENVPGAFTSNGGADFLCVLQEICRVKDHEAVVPQPRRWEPAGQILGEGFSVAWRVLDAQYWGVPQRRKRIFLVADFAGRRAPDILFKSEGLSGYFAEGFRAWQRAAGSLEAGAGEAGCLNWCINTQGNSGVYVTDDYTGALVAHDHGNHPAVLQTAPAPIPLENNPTDARLKISEEDVSQTLTQRMGTGGNNVPLVAEPSPMTLKIRCGHGPGGRGALVQTDKSATLATNNDQTLFQPVKDKAYGIGKEGFLSSKGADFNFAVNEELAPTMQASGPSAVAKPETQAFGVCAKSSFAMKSDNPHAGFYEADTSRTLDQSGGHPGCNQGGICVVSPAPEEAETFDVRFTSQGTQVSRGHCYKTEKSRCLDTSEANPDSNHGGIAVVAKGEHYSTSHGGFHLDAIQEQANTLVASDYKDPPLVNDPVYIVRRLTPVECARLQGFPDWWCADLETPDPTEEEIAFWTGVFETHQQINRPNGKPRTRKQIVKWLQNPHTDGAEYRLWGNGVCLPIVYFILSGIVWAEQE